MFQLVGGWEAVTLSVFPIDEVQVFKTILNALSWAMVGSNEDFIL